MQRRYLEIYKPDINNRSNTDNYVGVANKCTSYCGADTKLMMK